MAMKKAVTILIIAIIFAVTAVFVVSRKSHPIASTENSQNFSNFYKLLDQKILAYDVDGILKKHDELFLKIANKQISSTEANKKIQQLTTELKSVSLNSPKNLESWKHKKLIPTNGKTYFGNWHLRSFLLSKESLGADPAFAQMADQSKKVLISYIDVPIQNPNGNLQNMDEPILWNKKVGILPPPTLMIKAQLRRGAVPAIQLHLFDSNVEGWMKEQGAKIDKSKQLDVTDVINGKADDYLKKQIKILNEIDYPIVLLFINEFNLDAGKFFGSSGKELFFNASDLYGQYGDPKIPDGPERTKDSWIRLKKIMDEAGASSHISLASHAGGGHQNKAFPNPSSNANWNHMQYYWPGDGVMDYIGMSAYGYILNKNKDEMSLYGSAYYWWQEIKNSDWKNTPTFFNEFAPIVSVNEAPDKSIFNADYMSKYIQLAFGEVVPNDYPVSFVLFITPSNVPVESGKLKDALTKAVVDNPFYANTVKLK
jgi:hypothetical protein